MSRSDQHPGRAINIESLVQSRECLLSSGHTLSFVKEKGQHGKLKDDDWILKQFDHPLLAQSEAAMAGLCQLIHPELVPTIRPVYQASSMRGEDRYVATISKVITDFQDLKIFLADGINPEKIDYLIDHGLPEILVMSYFAENDDAHKENIALNALIDLDMAAYSLISEIRGNTRLGFSWQPKCDIKADDINTFPNLQHADFYYWLTKFRVTLASHGFSQAEVEAFSSLEHNERFIKKCYAAFLKIALLPDESIKRVFAENMSDEKYVDIFSHHFVTRKKDLREELKKSRRFLDYMKNLTPSVLEKMRCDFRKFNALATQEYAFSDLSVDMQMVVSDYYQFCCEIMDESIIAAVRALSEMIDYRRSKINEQLTQDQSIFSALVSLLDKISAQYKIFKESSTLSSGEIEEFVTEVKRILNAFKKLTPTDLAEQVLFPFTDAIDQLIMLCSAWTPQLQMLLHHNGMTAEAADNEVLKIKMQVPSVDAVLVSVPVLRPEEVVHEMALWLQKTRKHATGNIIPANRETVMTILQPLIDKLAANESTVVAQTTAYAAATLNYATGTFSSVVSSAQSWGFSAMGFFRAEPKKEEATTAEISVNVLQEGLLAQLNQIMTKIAVAKNAEIICHCISELFSISGATAKAFQKEFATALINQFLSEFCAANVLDQICANPNLAGYLQAQMNNKVDSSDVDRIVELFIRECEPGSADDPESDYCCVEHNSSKRFPQAGAAV